MHTGWKCMECGRVNAPWIEFCPHSQLPLFPQQPVILPFNPTPTETPNTGTYPPIPSTTWFVSERAVDSMFGKFQSKPNSQEYFYGGIGY